MSEENKPEDKPQNAVAEVLRFDDRGVVQYADQAELRLAARLMMNMETIPKTLKEKGPGAMMSAVLLMRQFNLPITAMNEMGYIKDKITCYGSLVTALVERHPEYGEMKVFYLDDKQDEISYKNKNLNADVWACVILIRKKGHDDWNEFFFTKDEAKTAGLLGNNTYTKYLKDMLYHKAKNRAFRTCYSSAMNGLVYHEAARYEAESIQAEKDVSPIEELNKKMGLAEGKFYEQNVKRVSDPDPEEVERAEQ